MCGKFFAILGCRAHLQNKLSPKLLEIDQDNLRMKLNWCRASHEHKFRFFVYFTWNQGSSWPFKNRRGLRR